MEIKDVMAQLGITQAQADALDALDGKDGKISEDVFTRAKKLASGDELYLNPPRDLTADGLFMRVRDIFVNNNYEVIEELVPIKEEKTELKDTKPLKAYQIDYTTFKNKDRNAAKDFAESALEQVKTLVDEYNKDYPQSPYITNYNDFPKPEEFTQFKKDAYTSWRASVDQWVDDIRNELRDKKDWNLRDVTLSIDQGFRAIGDQLGLDAEFLNQKLNELGGDINLLNECLKQTRQAIIANDNKNAKTIMNQAVINTLAIYNHIEDDGDMTRNMIFDEATSIKDEVQITREKTLDSVDKKAQQTQEINALSDAISSALNISDGTMVNILGAGGGRVSLEHSDKTIKRVETLKQKIVSDKNMTHEEKITSLTRLRNLVIEDEWITKKELDKVLEEEEKKIILKSALKPPSGGAIGYANRSAKP